ncbi:hypothetical protein F7725_020677 [Dissostichus mawsoni]|uniref:Caspase family p10 domain-containing protein n=1 Tax=Dissostichus mawsoni TaxID=36200 RepID=A0A7J5YFV5_DISMA|nr:hypothetical protein F7725_020677 [Dissostichus mawsoni]
MIHSVFPLGNLLSQVSRHSSADIDELFRKVMQRFEDFSVNNKRQMPTKDRVTLTRRFYFFFYFLWCVLIFSMF